MDELLDMDIMLIYEALNLLALQGKWPESMQDWVQPVIKKDPTYLEKMKKARGL